MKQSDTAKRVLLLIRPYWVKILLLLFLSIVTVVSTLYVPILIGNAIDSMIGPGNVLFPKLEKALISLATVIVITALAQWTVNRLTNQVTFRIIQDIRNTAFRRLNELPLTYLDGHQSGDIVSRIATDADQLSEGLFLGFTQFFTGVMMILGPLVVMLTISVRLTLIVVVVTPASLFVAWFVAKKSFIMFRHQSGSRGAMTALVEEMVGNQKVVQAFSYEKKTQERFHEINERLKVYSTKAVFFSAVSNPSTRFFNALVYGGVGIFGAFSVINGGMSIGQLSSILNYANQYSKPFNEISGVVTELQNAFASAARIFALIDEMPEIQDDSDAVVLSDVEGCVDLQDVSFSYQQGHDFIRGLNLSVSSGQKIALVGPTGCGKTTVINLLMRFYDVTRGFIAIEGTDIRRVTRDSLRGSFGMVLQETWLKSGTIHDNIAYGKPSATRREVIHAAKRAQAHGFIRRMPDGYDTLISEEEGNLSQGQKQLLCIARVMLMEPAMLILDEATSSIDTMTEARITKAFERLMEGRTSFIVAHRLSTIQSADTILVMKDGSIIETGNHEELLEKQGFYAALYQSQFASEVENAII